MQAANPVCIVVYRDPVENALSLMRNAKKSAARSNSFFMSLCRWLAAWHEGASAKARRGRRVAGDLSSE